MSDILVDYQKHCSDRAALGIPPLPLTAEQATAICEILVSSATATDLEKWANLLAERVAPGVDPAAKVKAEFLLALALDEKKCPAITPSRAVELLGTMRGGYNEAALLKLLPEKSLADTVAPALSKIILIAAENFAQVEKLANTGNAAARRTLENWAAATWFTSQPPLPDSISLRVYKIAGVTTTDDLSPAAQAISRSDIPLHALAMGKQVFPDAIKFMADCRAKNEQVAFVGDTVGVGSSRKSAGNSLIWHIGQDLPCVPNKRRGGIVIAAAIAPIFFNTLEDGGALPIVSAVAKLSTGQLINLSLREEKITDDRGNEIAKFNLQPATLLDEYRAGGRIPLIIGKQLTARAAAALKKDLPAIFIPAFTPSKIQTGFSLAQKIIGRAVGKEGVVPGETCQPRISTIGSQDTTGPMTRDELTELACLRFSAPFVLQSFCHTAAYPKPKDQENHQTLAQFMVERGGVALRPGDGIIHSWLNRFLPPDEVGAGGDSHTRFPLGISFAVGSGLTAFAAAFGVLPIDLPESVLVKINGSLPEKICLRDVVNYLPLRAIELGLQSPFGKGEQNIFNGRILEMEGLTEKISVAAAFELSCASAERNASACTVALSLDAVREWVVESVEIIDDLIAKNYHTAATLKNRRDELKKWLAKPKLLRRDDNAEFAAVIEIDLAQIREPVVACPNSPDAVNWLSVESGRAIDEVFIGSCMTNYAHLAQAAKILDGNKIAVKRLWIAPATRFDAAKMQETGILKIFENAGARIEIAGCSLCMGNQARVENNATVFSTSTRNFNHRLGDGAQVYLGSASLAAVVAVMGKIPTKDEYFVMA